MSVLRQSNLIADMEIFPCPICGSQKYTELFADRNRRDSINCEGIYVQCCECTLVYLRKRPQWQNISKFYSLLDPEVTANAGRVDMTALHKSATQPVGKWKRILRKIRFRPHSWPLESVSPGSKRILDLGCGNGVKLVEFANRGYDVYGVDVSTDAIEVCQKLLPRGHFIVSELEKINLQKNSFDYIRIDNALEHVPNPQLVINECYHLLKQGGQLMIYVPHGRSFTFRIMKGNSISSWIPFHLQLFTKESISLLLSKAMFTNKRIYSYYPNIWLPLSIKQWKTRKSEKPDAISAPKWLVILCYPIGWGMSKLGMAEELVTVAWKN